MARILPDTPPLSLPGEVLRVFCALKALPDSFFIWHHLAPWQPNAPDFLVISQEGRALLAKVISAAASQVTPAAQFLLLESERAPLGVAEARVLTDFIGALKLPNGQLLETLVIFPNIPDDQVQVGRLERGHGDPAWIGKELLNSDAGEGWSRFLPDTPLEPFGWKKSASALLPKWLFPLK